MKSAVGVPNEQIWKELGYTEAEIDQFTQMAKDAMKAQAQAFAAGRVGGLPGEEDDAGFGKTGSGKQPPAQTGAAA